ncbi:MAG: NUDIX domain-containing protein [Nitrosomonas sp.]|nr:MAG: NUDIX domain-containing protein [Nitrosomonas sp.]
MQDCALGIVFGNNRKEVLLVQRRDVPIWVLPGGGIDDGETAEQAVIRELYEETGLRVTVARQAATYAPVNRFTTTAHIFECSPIDNGTPVGGEEARAISFFPLDALPKTLFHYHREWLAEVLSQPHALVAQTMSSSTFWSIIGYYLRHPLWSLRYLVTRILKR